MKLLNRLLPPSAESIRVKQMLQDPRTAPSIKRVLLLEDDDFFTSLMQEYAEGFNFVITAVKTLKEAYLQFENSPPFDSIFLDVRLSNGSGIDFYRQVHAAQPKTHVVFMTGFYTEEVRRKVETVGPARVHPKDILANRTFTQDLFRQWGFVRI